MGISTDSPNQTSEDDKVDILECGYLRDEYHEEEEEEKEEEASSSSSFGDSICARDDDDDGEEAQSILSKDYPLPETSGFNGSDEILGSRKKKVRDDWRRFRQPLMWRCKWLELKVKEIESQAKGYEKEVNDYYVTKLFDLAKSKSESLEAKSIPFRAQRYKKAFERRRRKRVEETTDVAAYMSNHSIFSYAEKRKPTTLKAQIPDPDFGIGRKGTSKEDTVEDDWLDCSDDFLAKILCKIDEAQARARELRKRVDQFQSIGPSQIDLTVQYGNKQQRALVEEPLSQREGTVQIGRQRISADHTGDVLLMPQAPFPQDPLSTMIEDILMDDTEMTGDETETEKEKLDYFMKLINEITGVSPVTPEEAEGGEEDPTPVTKRRKTEPPCSPA